MITGQPNCTKLRLNIACKTYHRNRTSLGTVTINEPVVEWFHPMSRQTVHSQSDQRQSGSQSHISETELPSAVERRTDASSTGRTTAGIATKTERQVIEHCRLETRQARVAEFCYSGWSSRRFGLVVTIAWL